MTNLFINAEFGDEFIRRDGKIARYCGFVEGDTDEFLECDGVVTQYNSKGQEFGVYCKSPADIVAKKVE